MFFSFSDYIWSPFEKFSASLTSVSLSILLCRSSLLNFLKQVNCIYFHFYIFSNFLAICFWNLPWGFQDFMDLIDYAYTHHTYVHVCIHNTCARIYQNVKTISWRISPGCVSFCFVFCFFVFNNSFWVEMAV